MFHSTAATLPMLFGKIFSGIRYSLFGMVFVWVNCTVILVVHVDVNSDVAVGYEICCVLIFESRVACVCKRYWKYVFCCSIYTIGWGMGSFLFEGKWEIRTCRMVCSIWGERLAVVG